MQGAADARKNALETPFEKNSALLYAAVRNILLRKGKQVEIVANYEPSLHYVSEWWKQLYGESEGKDQKGIFPAAVDLTTDLHSMGQFIQDGARIMFETVLEVAESPAEVILKKEDVDTDGMNYLAGKSVDFVNKSTYRRQCAEPESDDPGDGCVQLRTALLFLRICLRRQWIPSGRQSVQPAGRREL